MDSTHKEIIRNAPAIETDGDSLAPIKKIRTETVLSRLPIHNLAKTGRVNIQIMKKDPNGQVTLQWEVSHSDRYGQPRQVAYKFDTIVINRKLDEQGRPLPRMVCLGSLREIADELGLGGDTNVVRRAIRQNAFAAITAKLTYRTADGGERRLEADFTRYSVIFTGEKLPDGRKADAVYIILNEPYREVLNNAPQRPLNYEYLKILPPAAQRFYEVLSYRVFAALKTGNPEAKILYSDYCMFSAQQRYYDYDHSKKQMWKIHNQHLKSGYLKTSRYTSATDSDGNADWMMCYEPGPMAIAEFKAFGLRKGQQELFTLNAVSLETGEWQQGKSAVSAAAIALVKYFHKRVRGEGHYELPSGGKEGTQAEDLIQTYGEAATRFLVDYGCRKAEQTNFSMRFFGALLQYVPAAMAAFEESNQAAAKRSSADEIEAERKRRYEDWFNRGRSALAALSADERTALEEEISTSFQSRWAPRATAAENHFFKRMVESAMITKLLGAGPDAPESTQPTRLS